MAIHTFLNRKSSGKSTLLANLAISIARRDSSQKVILVDLNLITPDLAYIFNEIDEQKKQYPVFLDELYRYIRIGETFEVKEFLTPTKDVPNLFLMAGTRNLAEDFNSLQESNWRFLFNLLKQQDVLILVDTGRYQNNSLFQYLTKASDKLIIVQDQDLFGAAHSAFMVSNLLQFVAKEKIELWISRYEVDSPITVSYIEELLGLKAAQQIPGMPRKDYNQSILLDKPLGLHNIKGYTSVLDNVAASILGQAPIEERSNFKWKLPNLRKKSTAI
ncbi:MAG: hypothetical protein AB7G87_01285 [Clostridia bacterium]